MPRQRVYRTDAFILKRMDLGEAHRVLTLYTREHGKLRAVAKGVRRTTSRSAGHLELFTLADVLLARGRDLDVVSQADTRRSFRAVREDLDRTSYAYYMAELVDQLTEDRMENRGLFEALADGLGALEEQPDARVVLLAFLLRLLDVLGYRPELRQCVACRSEIAPGLNRFSAHLGGAVCPACGQDEPSGRIVSNDALKVLRYFQTARARSVAVPPAVSREAELLLREYAESIMESRLRAPRLIASVGRAGTGADL